MKTLASGALFVILTIAAAIVGVIVWLAWEVGNRAIAALDGIGPGIFTAGALVTFFAFCLVIVGGAIAIVRGMALRSRQIQHRDGLYPQVYHHVNRQAQYIDLNAQHAQLMAVMHQHRGARAGAASVGRLLDWQSHDVPQLPEPAAEYPQRVQVYDVPSPRTLALPVGVDGAGKPVELPLRNLGNVLVGGLPGSGKSELLASMMAGLLRQDASGRTVQVAAVDTKLVSFGLLPNLAGLYARPALTVEDAHALVIGLAAEVQRRFELLHGARVRSLEELEMTTGERLPYVVAFVDELADMTTDPDKARRDRFLALAQEIGRKGRAAGVALVMATQRPSADVIPSSLRNLAGAAVAFRVSRNHDSIAVLGEPGADLLPAVPGRCLVRHSDVVQVQGYLAGLEGGQFDRFCAALPQVTTLQPLRTDGAIPINNWPTTATVEPVVAGCSGSEPVVQPLEAGREPDAQLAAQLRQMHANGWSKTALCNATWGYKDGAVWQILDRVLSGEL